MSRWIIDSAAAPFLRYLKWNDVGDKIAFAPGIMELCIQLFHHFCNQLFNSRNSV